MILPDERVTRAIARRWTRALPATAVVLTLLGILGGAAADEAQPAPRMRLLASGDVLGSYEPCDCADRPLGGLSQRAFVVTEARRVGGSDLVLDAGNLLFRSQMALSEDAENRRRVGALALVDAYGLMAVDAVNLGPHDLAGGLEYLQLLQGRAGFPFVSSNLVDETGAPVFTPRLMVERDDARVAVIGVLPGDMQGAGYRTTDPIAAAREAAAGARADGAELVVLLSSLGVDEGRKLARKVKDVDLILGCGDRARTDPPVWVGDTLLVHPGSRGKDVTVVDWVGGAGKDRFVADVLLVERGGPVDEAVEELVQEAKVRHEAPDWQEAAPRGE